MGKCFIPHRLFTDPHLNRNCMCGHFTSFLLFMRENFLFFPGVLLLLLLLWMLILVVPWHLFHRGPTKTFALSAYTQAFSEISGIITMFYVVRALSPYTEYEFYVIAVNNIGRGPPSIPATTTTGETGKKQTFKRIVMNSHCLSLSSFSHFFNWFI